MEILELRPGTPMEFSVASINANGEANLDGEKNNYISSVFGVTKNEEILFHIPTRGGHTVTVPMNINFDVVFNTRAGMFQLSGEITKRGKLENFPIYVFEPSTKLQKVQRRDYYRFNCLLPIKVLPIPEDVALLPSMTLVEDDLEKYGNTYGDPVEGNVVDISGGGARFKARREVQTERYMYCSFVLSTPTLNKIINVICRKVKVEYDQENNVYIHRIEFLFKEPDDREIIIKYIFDEERRLRKKEQG
ncbi:MAG: flagellar brake domain-containing protein [Pseudobutyrivibrio sp.]|nr:flagellar brake domain-containing protein [Pseudobutyrivibrio sp.]